MNLLKYEMEMRRRARPHRHSASAMSSVGSPLESGHSSEPVEPKIRLVSTCKTDKISAIFSSFGVQKASLLKSIGFDGLLRLPTLESLSDHLTLWLYQRFDFKTMCLHLDGGVDLYIREADVKLIFGIPFEGHRVNYGLNQTKETIAALQEKLSGQTSLSCLRLSSLEDILSKEYGPVMSAQEIDGFSIASVLLSMCYFLAPLTHQEFPMHLIKNFVPDVKVADMNWAQYVLWILGRAAFDVQAELSSGSKEILMYGCSLLLQVFYIDNLNFGPSTPYHIILPRASAYSHRLLSELTISDSNGISDDKLMIFGRRQVRPAVDVCYTRGWQDHVKLQGQLQSPTIHDYLTSIEMQSDGIHLVQNFGRQLNQFMTTSNETHLQPLEPAKSSYMKFRYRIKHNYDNLCTKSADLIKRRNLRLYHHHIPGDVHGTSEKRLLIGSSKQAVMKRTKSYVHIEPHTSIGVTVGQETMNIVARPIDMEIHHPEVPWKDKARCYQWMSNLRSPTDKLDCDWIVFSKPEALCIRGHVVQQCLKINGYFNVNIVDAIMVIWSILDEKLYSHEKLHKRWRHFLPASFAEIVNDDGDFLNSKGIVASFIGDHITYDVQDCQKIIIPVLGDRQTWSCFFWDFKLKTISVLDPLLINSSPNRVREKHRQTVFKLHTALFSCKDRLFPGWDIKPDGWADHYITDIGRRCMPQNSGLYAVHYARSFGGSKIAFDIKNSNEADLSGARGEILYHIFSCAENLGYKPTDLMGKLALDC